MKQIVFILLYSAFIVGFFYVGGNDEPARPEMAAPVSDSAHHGKHASATTEKLELGPRSLYHLKSVWTNQNLEAVEWSSFQGRPILIAMFYTHCGYTCPRIVHDLKGILSELPQSERRTVGVVLVSIDPEHDTPEALKAFGQVHGLVHPQWNLLTGDERDVRELAAVLDIRYQAQPGGDFAHSNTITLLGPGGEILARKEGLSATNETILAALRGMTPSGGGNFHDQANRVHR